MSHTISNVNNLTVKIIDVDINALPVSGQAANRGAGFALSVAGGADKIISQHVIRRKDSNKCQLLVIYEDNSP